MTDNEQVANIAVALLQAQLAERDKEIEQLRGDLTEFEWVKSVNAALNEAHTLLVERSFSKAEIEALLAVTDLPVKLRALRSARARLEKMRDERS